MRQLLTSAFIFFTTIIYSQTIEGNCTCWTSDGAGGAAGPFYGTGDIVYITGTGIFKDQGEGVPWPADFYVVPNDNSNGGGTVAFSLDDILNGVPNTEISLLAGGAFADIVIAAGPLPAGEYDIVIDNNRDGYFNKNTTDCYIGVGSTYAFSVTKTPFEPWQAAEIQRLKDKALDEYMKAAEMHLYLTLAQMLPAAYSSATGKVSSAENIIGKVSEVMASFKQAQGIYNKIKAGAVGLYEIDALKKLLKDLVWKQLTEIQEIKDLKKLYDSYTQMATTDYDKLTVNLFYNVSKNVYMANMLKWGAIAMDPPNNDFFKPTPLDTAWAMFYPSISDNKMVNAQADFANAVEIENMALEGLLHSWEKMQGALNATADVHSRTQAKAAQKYLSLIQQTQQLKANAVDSMLHEIALDSLYDLEFSMTKFQHLKQVVANKTLTPEEITDLANQGISPLKWDSIKNSFLAFTPEIIFLGDTARIPNGRFSNVINAYKQHNQNTSLTLDSIYNSLQVNLVNNVNGVSIDMEPHAIIAGPTKVNLGQSVTLTANNSNSNLNACTYQWDFNNDSTFNDAIGASVLYSPTTQGYRIVGVKATNGYGSVDYAYYVVKGVSLNKSPIIVSKSPTVATSIINQSASITFSVNVNDPDGDPVTITWYKNSIQMGTGNSYLYTSNYSGCVTQADEITVEVSDNNLYSNNAFEFWTVLYHNKVYALMDDTSNCSGNSILLNPSYSYNDGATYNWSNSTTDTALLANSSGLYWVEVSRNGCIAKDSAVVALTSIPAFSLGNDTTCTNCQISLLANLGSGYNYSWSTGSLANSIVVTSSGTYYLEVEKAGCFKTDSITVTINNNTSIEEIGLSSYLVYPNPANDIFSISYTSIDNRSIGFDLVDLYGRKILEIAPIKNQVGVNRLSIDVSSFAKGIYLIKATTSTDSKVLTRVVVN
ncbi:MAG: PKD domain-containing protein [Bacteroidetes bacterium]|nr:PKD domain-containing protein [Bacteroidota bacterium]